MKTHFFIINILVIVLLNSITLKGQSGCSNSGCINDTLNISTGYDPLLSTYKTPLALESNWQLSAVPSNTTITPSAPVWVISPHIAWGNYANAKWLSPFQNYTYLVNNLPLPTTPYYGPFTFENCFCLCQQTTVRIKFDYMADDQTEAYLDGTTLLASGIAPMSGHFTLASQLSVDTTITLAAGQHCLTIDLYNVGSVAMGFALQGYVSGANMLSSVCCNATGNICGTKLKDADCDSVVDQVTDMGVPGWKIVLNDSLGNPIDTVVTDTLGNYCFHDLPSGTYIVSELGQIGWTQTYPAGSGTHTIQIVAGSAVIANFGNCDTAVDICGTKYNDINGDSVITIYDPTLTGWKIYLKNSLGVIIDSTTTDANGAYCFRNLPAGTYNVAEGTQSNWAQTYPGGTGEHTIMASAGNNYSANFANCKKVGTICVQKFKDVDCDGTLSESDPLLAGWMILLKDSLGVVIDTVITTGGSGQCFTDLPLGTYTIEEVNQPYWTQTYPGGAGTHTVNVTMASFTTVNFLNCFTVSPCDSLPDFDIEINNCFANFTPVLNVLTAGGIYQVISTVWDFGDGSTSTATNPGHYYQNPGTYNVCLTVTLFNGDQCCRRKICKEINIDKKCGNGCDMQGSIVTDFNAERCEYTFTGMVSSAGIPVTGWFWEFGDGTTGTGYIITHQFPTPGSYNVCVTFISSQNEMCCMTKVCVSVDVECDPCDVTHNEDDASGGLIAPDKGKGTDQTPSQAPTAETSEIHQSSITLSDKNMVVLNQNVPNPFAESTVISYIIPNEFKQAQLVFVDMGGKMVKTVSITSKGYGQLTVFADDLSTGVYKYVLLIDGKIRESKTMMKQ